MLVAFTRLRYIALHGCDVSSDSITGRQHRMGYLGDLPAGLAGCAACSADCTARLAAQGIRAIILPSLSVTLDATPCRTAPIISSAAFRILQGEGSTPQCK